jgi:hypothetical protein
VPQSLIPLSVHPLSYPLYRSLILPAMHSHLSVRLLSCSAVGPLDRSTVGPFGPAIGPYRSAVVPLGCCPVRLVDRSAVEPFGWDHRLLDSLAGTVRLWIVGCGTVSLSDCSAVGPFGFAVGPLGRSAVGPFGCGPFGPSRAQPASPRHHEPASPRHRRAQPVS